MKYWIILAVIALVNVPAQIAFWWYAFGFWPTSWLWFILFSLYFWGQAEVAKWLMTRFAEQLRNADQ